MDNLHISPGDAMSEPDLSRPLIIIGASARAAACSAWRAGYTPYWLDSFGDEDLRRRFAGQVISAYPDQAVELLDNAPAAPFIYTGALENHPRLLERLCRRRTLLGNPAAVCLGVTDPRRWSRVLQRQHVPVPALRTVKRGAAPRSFPDPGNWLLKPLRSGCGIGIAQYQGQPVDECHYLQAYLSGESCSAVFIGSQGRSRLLGVTRQLVGRPECRAAGFSYCGSIGPLELNAGEKQQWERIGAALAGDLQLRGLFGVDAIRQDGGICPVEVNPRYTASVEVLELALDARALPLHVRACAGDPINLQDPSPRHRVGKAILYAPEDLIFGDFPRQGFSVADVPAAGAQIRRGQPLLTILVHGTGVDAVTRELLQAAENFYSGLRYG